MFNMKILANYTMNNFKPFFKVQIKKFLVEKSTLYLGSCQFYYQCWTLICEIEWIKVSWRFLWSNCRLLNTDQPKLHCSAPQSLGLYWQILEILNHWLALPENEQNFQISFIHIANDFERIENMFFYAEPHLLGPKWRSYVWMKFSFGFFWTCRPFLE